MLELSELKSKGLAPKWYKDQGYATVKKGYLLKGETPKGMYTRVAKTAARYLKMPELEDKFFKLIWNNWLCPASPVLSNSGTDRGLPISCFTNDIGDSIEEITKGIFELGMLTKNGGGVGVNFNRIRPRGSLIKSGKNGTSEGIIPFIKMYDSAILGIAQGATRRGAASINLNIEHGDWEEFVRIRRPEGDINRLCQNIHHCTVINDEFMNRVVSGDRAARIKWTELMRTRMETGEPYVMFKDTVNKNNPKSYKLNGLDVDCTNICSEIVLHTDSLHTFVCCLSSLNLNLWDEWKDKDVPFYAALFLNGILNEFIEKARYKSGLEKAVDSAIKGRAIGIGVLGWHSLLQKDSIPFESFSAMMLNSRIFKHINESSLKASEMLAKTHGEPEWCRGTGEYNSHRIAVAPTRSNSIISGSLSPGIEPIIANAYIDKSAKGSYIIRNPNLERLLESKDKNNDEIWKLISRNEGSVQELDFLTDDEKNVFKTAYELDQNVLINQAAQRQKFICQSQSLNLFFPNNVEASYFNDVHLNAWRKGVKTLYYCRSKSVLKVNHGNDECLSCEG